MRSKVEKPSQVKWIFCLNKGEPSSKAKYGLYAIV